ncbi:MAG: hypothetical protein ACE10D_04730 [Planctomycetota bacterium]
MWRHWLDNDPVEMIERADCQAALRSMRLCYFDCGSKDEYNLQLGQRLMVNKLERLGISHEAQEFPDDHRSISYRYDVSVPKLVAALLGE